MAAGKLETNKEYICREQISGDSIAGQLMLTDEKFRVRLVSFDDYFLLNQENEVLPVRLEDNSYVTLYNAYFGGPGGSHSRTEKTHNQTITANTLVHGWDKWRTDDPIKYVAFELPYAGELLRDYEKIKELETSSPWSDKDTYAIQIEVRDMKVRLGYRMSGSFMTEQVRVKAPVFAIEFCEPRKLNTYLNDVQSIVQFVAIILRRQMDPEEIRICRISDLEMMSQVKKGEFLGEHSVRQLWFKGSDEKTRDARTHSAFARMFDKAEKDAFQECMKTWIARESLWKRPNALMIETFRLQNEISAERMLAACKWLEEIPSARHEQVVDDGPIQKIVEAARKSASALGLGEALDQRIGPALSRLKMESHKQRFSRLVKHLNERFSIGFPDEKMTSHLIAAARDFRGKVAHGHFEPKDEQEDLNFFQAILAVEALCFLMTVSDLPITKDGVERLKYHPAVENYRHCLVA